VIAEEVETAGGVSGGKFVEEQAQRCALTN
jgi:hypothetical protein